jgi:hypothetical protein
MLFNPIWSKTTAKPDIYALDTLIAWLEEQKPGMRYDYKCGCTCMLARYFTDKGFKRVMVQRNFVSELGSNFFNADIHMLPEFFDWIAGGGEPIAREALSRARLARDNPALAREVMLKTQEYCW